MEITKSDEEHEILSSKYTDDYVKENWREFVYADSSFEPNYYKSEQYRQDRGEYLLDKYKCS